MSRSALPKHLALVHVFDPALRRASEIRTHARIQDPKELHEELGRLIADADEEARDLGLNTEDRALAWYMVAALLDEAVLTRENGLEIPWTPKLVDGAGMDAAPDDNFYARVVPSLARSSRQDLVELARHVLRAGFRGKGVADPSALRSAWSSLDDSSKSPPRRGLVGEEPSHPLAATPLPPWTRSPSEKNGGELDGIGTPRLDNSLLLAAGALILGLALAWNFGS